MSDSTESSNILSPEALRYYERDEEQHRLLSGEGQLELVRTQELLRRYLPLAPAVILDVGGGPGVYAFWLARLGYEVHLIDAAPNHIEQARQAAQAQPEHPVASLSVGDARKLERPDASVDAVLLLGPLYHLTERNDRVTALRETRRVLKPGGVVFAVGISRFASLLDGLASGYLDDPEYVEIVRRDLTDGQHRNPNNHPHYFTTTFFHHPEELRAEIREAGLQDKALLAVEGPPLLLKNFSEHWNDGGRRERLLTALRWIEAEPSMLGVTGHMMAVANKVVE